jgi:Rieske 2Fe-2S family protein
MASCAHFLNVCRHRGAQLCTAESGSVKRAFQCPYHAWTYGLDGKLIAAPNLASMPDIDRTAFGLNAVPLRARLITGVTSLRCGRGVGTWS